jgi:hypothetical protein
MVAESEHVVVGVELVGAGWLGVVGLLVGPPQLSPAMTKQILTVSMAQLV